MKQGLLLVFAFFVLFQQGVSATEVEFSAETYQKSPQGTEQDGKIYVGRDRFRTETNPGVQQVVRIVDKGRGRQWVLFPGKKSYAEQDMQGAAPDQPKREISPCDGLPEAHCERLGEEDLAGRKTIKWKMTFDRDGKVQTITQWIDKAREIPLRSEMSNGHRMEMRMIGSDSLGGRIVEKWESVIWGVDKESPRRSFQWYDSELNLVIREELPGGFLREMKNIKIGAQDDALFVVPPGWTKIKGSAITQ